jgi:hypothetical protein
MKAKAKMIKSDTKMQIRSDKIQKTMRFGLGYFRCIFILSVRGALGSKSSTYRQAIKRAT